jgi:hypothetical protein
LQLQAERRQDGRHALVPQPQPGRRWADWLADEADPSEVYEFMRVHQNKLDIQAQDPRVIEAVAQLKEQYILGVEEMVDRGWYAESALQAIETIEETDIYVGDLWDTMLQGYQGYHNEGQGNWVVVAQGIGVAGAADGIEELVARVPETGLHELQHVAFGHNFKARWLKEAVTEHVTVVTQAGMREFNLVDPLARREDTKVYTHERILLHTLLNNGVQAVPVWKVTKAYSSNSTESPEMADFIQSVDKAWGRVGMLELVTMYYDDRADELAAEHPDWQSFQVQREAATLTTTYLKDLRIRQIADQETVRLSSVRPAEERRSEH